MPDRRSLPRVPDVAGDPSSQLLSSPVSAVTSAPSYLLRLPPSISVTSMDCPRDTGHRTLLPHGTCPRGKTRISGSLSWGAREVSSLCAWRGGARHGSPVMGED